jgi:hypothetical protein
MRLPIALLVAGLLLPLAGPTVHAQAAAPPADGAVRILEDRFPDVKMSVAGTPQDPPGNRWAAADLKSLDVLETTDDFTFTLAVGSLSTTPEAPFAESTDYTIGFVHKDRQFQIEIFRFVLQSAGYDARLLAYDPALDRYDQVVRFQEVKVDTGAATMAVTFSRDLFTDHNGNAPHPEVPFTGWHAAAQGGMNGMICINSCASSPVSASDAMPDQGNGTLDLAIRYGISQVGHARLSSESPTRASNGEATTIVYQIDALNLADANETFALAASGVPAGWEVKLPADRLTVPGNGTVVFPVLLTVPFAHQHGTYQKFLLELKSLGDPGTVGRIQLGIRYSQPPQPAGHHSTLWLHSRVSSADQLTTAFETAAGFSPDSLSMNALPPDQDGNDAKVDVPGVFQGQNLVPPQAIYRWNVPLSPALEMGLDFDLARHGNFTVPIKTTLPMLGTVLSGHITYYGPDNQTGQPGGGPPVFGGRSRVRATVLADLVPGTPTDIGANSEGTFLATTIVPRQDADYIPYAKGASLQMDFQVAFTRADGLGGSFGPHDAPVAQPGGLLDLPLLEYHDKVAQVFASNSTLMLKATSLQDRTTNPGKMVLYNLTLMNHGSTTLTVNLELTGTHLLWAEMLEPAKGQIKLAPGDLYPVKVAVKVPTEADKGDAADLVLSATSASDLNIRSLARLYTTVDTAKQYPDDAPTILQLEGVQKKKSPGFELPIVVAGLALLALARRRRQ